MTSRSGFETESPAPLVHVAPSSADTYGDLAADLAGDYGLVPDEWQQLVLDDWLAVNDGRWASLKCGLSVPRQNGKNAALEVRELFGMIGRGEKILHTAHQVKTAQKHFRRLKHFFGKSKADESARFPELNALVEELRNVNGQEAIFLKNGGSVELVARSQGSGRGFTVDVIVCDEAQDMSDDDLEALLSTSSAGPRGDPQWIFAGTPPGPKANGEVFTRTRSDSLSGKANKSCWHEWSAELGDDLDSVATWTKANPGLVSGRLLVDVIEAERTTFSDGGFARERLGIWRDDISLADAAIMPDEWKASGVLTPPTSGIKALGVKFAPDGSRVAVSGAIKPTAGPIHVELVGAHSGSMAAGTASLATWVAERWKNYAAIVVDGKSHAGAFVNALVEAGVPKHVIVTPTWPEVATANSMLLDAVIQKQMTHLATEGQQQLDTSVAQSPKKIRGVEGAWSFVCPADPGGEVPISSAALAHWGAKTKKPRTNKAVFA